MLDGEGIAGDQSGFAGGFPAPADVTHTDADGLACARRPRQVLDIATGRLGRNAGGFFPNGLRVCE